MAASAPQGNAILATLTLSYKHAPMQIVPAIIQNALFKRFEDIIRQFGGELFPDMPQVPVFRGATGTETRPNIHMAWFRKPGNQPGFAALIYYPETGAFTFTHRLDSKTWPNWLDNCLRTSVANAMVPPEKAGIRSCPPPSVIRSHV